MIKKELSTHFCDNRLINIQHLLPPLPFHLSLPHNLLPHPHPWLHLDLLLSLQLRRDTVGCALVGVVLSVK